MRKPRVVVPGMPHHIFNRGNNKRRLFSYPRDFRRMLWDVENALDVVAGIVIHALVLMANHLHMIVVPESKEALSRFMKQVAQHYAVYRNRGRKSSGKLFEERYLSKPIRTEAQLAITMAYIELNPVRAFIVQQPEDYSWSTHRLYAGDERGSAISPRILTPSPWYLGLSADPVERAQLYRDFVQQCLAGDLQPDEIELIAEKEREAQQPYTLRLERPNRNRACEIDAVYLPIFRRERRG